jgi:hypothetical protein
MTLDDMLRAIRDLIQHDIGNRGLARDPERNLINACPYDFAAACRSIGEHPKPSVAIVTGFWIPAAEPPAFETDGPLGAVFLSRAFQQLGISTEILSERECAKAVRIGLQVSAIPDNLLRTTFSSAGEFDSDLVCSPDDWQSGEIGLGRTSLGPSHWLAIERVGPAANARSYTMRGLDITDRMVRAEEYFTVRHGRSIGIGDGGNEIGMGKIPVETIERNIPNGRKIACRVATDYLIVAGISNWGAYALGAGVALVRGHRLSPELFDIERERRILQAMVEAGLVDGKTGRREATVDGIEFDEYIRPLVKIREIVEA